MKSIVLITFLLIFESGFASLVKGSHENTFIIENLDQQTVQEIVQMIRQKANGSQFLFLGESHRDSSIQKIQEALISSYSDRKQFSCVSIEGFDAQPVLNYLNTRNLSETEFRTLFRSYYQYYFALMNARGFKDQYSDQKADAFGNRFWFYHQNNMIADGHEADEATFLDLIYDMKFNNPGYTGKFDTYKEFEIHGLIRSKIHAQKIVEHFSKNQCVGMIAIAGGFHYLKQDEMIRFAKAFSGYDLKISNLLPIQDIVKTLTGKKTALINMMSFEKDPAELDIFQVGDADLTFLFKTAP
jgi:hypothetical protein